MSSSFSDYPDFMAQDLWVLPPLDNQVHANVASGQTIGPYFVAGMPAVGITLPTNGALASYVTIRVDQFADPALTQLVNGTFYIVPINRIIFDVIPVVGLYMVINFLGITGTVNVGVLLEPIRSLSAAACFGSGLESALQFNTVVAAGATLTTAVTHVSGRRAMWTVVTDATLWTSRLQDWTLGGATYRSVVGAMDNVNAGKGATVPVNMPTAACDWLFTNGDGVNRNVSGSVIYDRLAA